MCDEIIVKNVCGNCKNSFDDYSSGDWENGCMKGRKECVKDGGLTVCPVWEC